MLSSGTSSKAKRSYQRYIEGKIEEPDMYTEKDLDKLFSGSKDTYKDLMSGKAGKKYWDALKPTRNTYEDLMEADESMEGFKYGVVDPMMQQYSQAVLPALQQRFVDSNAGSSSALNQALAASAGDLTTQMGSLYLPYMQNQQQTRLAAAGGLSGTVLPYMQNMMQGQLAGAQGMAGLSSPYLSLRGQQQEMYQQNLANRLSALSGLGGLAGQQTFTPLISKSQGIMGPLIGAGGTALGGYLGGAAFAASSEKIKENIREYNKGLEVVKDLDVKIYDYKKEVGGQKNKVGVIAETVPEEIQALVSGIKGVDLYGLIGLLINSVKQLNEKIERLEDSHDAANCS